MQRFAMAATRGTAWRRDVGGSPGEEGAGRSYTPPCLSRPTSEGTEGERSRGLVGRVPEAGGAASPAVSGRIRVLAFRPAARRKRVT